MERHVANARAVATFLRGDPRIAWTNDAGFADHPSPELVRRILGGRASPLFTFGVEGGLEADKAFYDALGLVNIGDVKWLACHPASTTHRQMTNAEQLGAGVMPDLIRISVGIEHVDHIIADLDPALAAAVPYAGVRTAE